MKEDVNHLTIQEDPLEKEMENHSSTLVWKIPWIEESGGLQFMGLQRAAHDWATNTLQERQDIPLSDIRTVVMPFP